MYLLNLLLKNIFYIYIFHIIYNYCFIDFINIPINKELYRK